MSSAKVVKAARSKLSGLRMEGARWNDTGGFLEVTSSHAFLKALGYLKFVHEGPVLFRGQGTPYPTLVPSLFRDANSPTKIVRSDKAVAQRVTATTTWLNANNPFQRGTPSEVREPILQHYGFRTRWIDVVDNAWIALWFACHRLVVRRASDSSPFDAFHYLRREQPAGPGGLNATQEYAWIYILNMGRERQVVPYVDGLWETVGGAQIADLRRAAPSTYLRPHAQHGLLVRRKAVATVSDCDYGDFVVGVVRVGLEDASRWLGNGGLISVHSLFPPSHYDDGYAILLRESIKTRTPPVMGRIAIVEP